MRIHWYWPFARPEELDWATSTARAADRILVQVIQRPEAPQAGMFGRVEVVRDLADVNREVRGKSRWAISRASTYWQRDASRRRHWREESFDLVHLHYVNRFTDAASRLRHPLVMSVHDVMPHVIRLGTRTERVLMARTYSRADALVVHHSELADLLVRNLHVNTGKIHVIPHQVFPVGDVSDRPPDGPPTFLFFGALRPNKGLDVLAEAMARLPSRDIRLVIAGRGHAQVEMKARELALQDERVRLELGFVSLERKRQLFSEASTVVLPYTEFTSQSGVLHDAYGHGRPVIVTDVGALGSSVRHDRTGLVIPPGDADALATAMKRLLEPDTWEGYAQPTHGVRMERSPQAVGDQLRIAYDQILDKRLAT